MNKSDHTLEDPRNERQREKRHRRFVTAMRVVLTVVSVSLATAIILWPILNEEEVTFTLSYEDVARSNDQIRMVNPRYVGTDSRNRPFSIAAESGVQDSPDDPRIRLSGITAEFQIENDLEVDAYSNEGVFRFRDQLLELDGTVLIRTTDGYRFEGEGAEFNLATHVVTSDKRIAGSGPVGFFEAPQFELNIDDRRALFEGGVRMRIDPTGLNHRDG